MHNFIQIKHDVRGRSASSAPARRRTHAGLGVQRRVLEGSVASSTQHFGDELLEPSDRLAQLLQEPKDANEGVKRGAFCSREERGSDAATKTPATRLRRKLRAISSTIGSLPNAPPRVEGSNWVGCLFSSSTAGGSRQGRRHWQGGPYKAFNAGVQGP